MDGGVRNMERIETLRDLLDRLGSPDLTLAEAKLLRDRLFTLLGRDSSMTESHQVDPWPPSGRADDRPTGGRNGGGLTNLLLCSVG